MSYTRQVSGGAPLRNEKIPFFPMSPRQFNTRRLTYFASIAPKLSAPNALYDALTFVNRHPGRGSFVVLNLT